MASAAESPRSAPRRPGSAAVPKDGGAESILSPRFRSAAELAGWDEESVFAALIVEDTPVRESRRKRRSSDSAGGGGGSTGSNTRKRRFRRQTTSVIPPVILALDDDDDKPDDAALTDGKKIVTEKADEKVAVVGEKDAPGSGEKEDDTPKLPCMDRLREELSCAICLDICFEPSTTPCGHSFCMKCLKHAAAKCGKRCPKCRQLISNSRSCTVNTVLWNTIQLLFPNEVEARRTSIASSSSCNDNVNQSQARSGSFSQGGMRTRSSSGGSFITEGRIRGSYRTFLTPGMIREHGSTTSTHTTSSFIRAHGRTRGSDSRTGSVLALQLISNMSSSARTDGFVPASQLITNRSSSARSCQSHNAALAYRLQQEEFMNAFESEETHERLPRNSVSAARDI